VGQRAWKSGAALIISAWRSPLLVLVYVRAESQKHRQHVGLHNARGARGKYLALRALSGRCFDHLTARSLHEKAKVTKQTCGRASERANERTKQAAATLSMPAQL